MTWIISKNKTIRLIEHGQIHREAATKSDRLSVTANCSLVIKKVTDEDVGLYSCRQFVSGKQHGPDSHVYLSVITSEGETTLTTQSTSTTKSSTTTSETPKSSTSSKEMRKITTTQTKQTSVDRQTPTNNNNPSQQAGSSWWSVTVSVGSAGLLITAVVIFIWKKTKGNKKKEGNTAGPEDAVVYATVSHTKKTPKKSRAPDTVIYSSVRASSSAGVSN
ncbi:cell wall protein DAN4-like [Melanotaenia boesemani]|uniref:cell wall protein DAN4-like n=1 Tax=Melanotaenia boesemani TaxID=1250792 RepID=UPI001C05B35C|nr:cell wall protein DAN4-like [Melanotaenia boesemani]